MGKAVYTLGYQGRTPNEIKALAERLDAVVFDIRFRPFSAHPAWCRPAFESLLGPRYTWVKSLGNAAYRDAGAIRIVDLVDGVAQIISSPRPVILMCGCKDPARCHRSFVAAHLRELGISVEELNRPPATQLSLFD